MSDWFKRRLESFLDNLIFAGGVAVIVAVWGGSSTLSGPIILVITLVAFVTTLAILRLILSLVDRQSKKKSIDTGPISHTQSQPHEYISDTYIKGRLIYLMDLLAPGSKPIISNRTIEDCEIRGPAMAVALGRVSITEAGFDGDKNSLFVEIADARSIVGAIGLQDCVFRRCRFKQIGILGTKEQIKIFMQGMIP
jgi:hypothetical protein